ncbi:DnaA N-terminal domain-containing protein [Paracoccus sanguinis]|uniref:DnaA N-terminal domain-containing protein n=1 Tax=Paracoccus sanguinis TaxID=1545044 RepID=UPI001E29489D|nr:DnaA N-terminal domain-containing protein [Paracoccus sanguinis]
MTWLAPLSLRAIDSGAADIVCPTRFLSDWVSRPPAGVGRAGVFPAQLPRL